MATRKRPLEELPADIRRLLLFGECTPEKGTWRDQGLPNFRTFTLVSSALYDECAALWFAHRDSLMLEWKGRGRPWGYRRFELKEIGI